MSAQLVTPSGVELTGSAGPRATAGGARVDAAGEVKVDVTQLSAKDPRTQKVINLEEGVESLVELMKANMPQLPPVHVEWENLSYTVTRDEETDGVDNLWTAVTRPLTSFASDKRRRVFHVLNNVSGHLRPGTTTLLLAPPGHGKSALLKALAGRISAEKLAGHVWYGAKEINEVHARRLATYVDQADIHLPLLTVEETFQFAKDAWSGKLRPGMNDVMLEVDRRKVELVLRTLGLAHVKDTKVGDDLIRGVSGGEKKRVTFGELACTNARVMMMDEISTGLDSAATVDIVRLITQFTSALKGTCMISLLQPTPEVFALFDDVILMREGQIIYHGPQDYVEQYFTEMGLQFPHDQDAADFITAFISDPAKVYKRQLRHMEAEGQSSTAVPPLTTDDLVLYFKASTRGKAWGILKDANTARQRVPKSGAARVSGEFKGEFKGELDAQPSMASQVSQASAATDVDAVELLLDGEYAKVVYDDEYARRPFTEQVTHVLKRQWAVQLRNAGYLGPRVFQAVFMGLLLGAVFFNLGVDEYQMKFGLLFFASAFLSFANMSEVPIACADKLVVYKQTDARFYSAKAYVAGVMVTHIPLATVESLVFGTISYYMCGFAPEFSRYCIFLVLIWLTALLMSACFRLFAYASPNEDAAQGFIGPIIGLFMLFGGFLITYEKIPGWLIWVYWSTPFSWLIKALVVNEFGSSDYDSLVQGQRLGDVIMEAFNVSPHTYWVWGAIIYLAATFVIVGYLSSVVLDKIHYDASIGTSRSTSDDLDSPALRQARERRERRAAKLRSMSMSGAPGAAVRIAFEPMTVAFRDLHYSVRIKKDGQEVDKELLAGISGYATPGTLTALMGASGAGKSTLMDVICGRKSAGTMTGEILINGHAKDDQSFARVMGYVEQQDLIMPYATVRETLEFSAYTRLDAAVPPQRRKAFVDSIIDLLELGAIADQLVGDDSSSSSISAGERKRLTIGVELVANPTVLFADEPTSGLDSKAAASVMQALKRVAETGRTVVCTIHQPSAELFYMFDKLLLLQKGGKAVYFGSVERRAKDLVQYLEAVEGTHPLPPRTNPADWMLDVIGSGVAIGNAPVDLDKFPNAYSASALHASNTTELARHCLPKPGSKPLHFRHTYVRSIREQLPVVIKRQLLGAWRNTGLNYTRLVIFIGLALLFGLLFFQLDWESDLAGVNSLNAFIFMSPLFNAIVFMNTAMPVMSRERAVFYRERASRSYASIAYSTAVLVAEIPFAILGVGVYQGISYWMVGLSSDFGTFMFYLMIAVLLALACVSFGQFLVAILPNKQAAQILSSGLLSVWNLFSGFFVPKPALSAGSSWLWYCSPMSYSFNAMGSVQFHCEGASCPHIATVSSQGVGTAQVSDYMDQTMGFDYDDRWTMVIVLCAWFVVLHAATALSLAFVNHLKR